MTHVYPQQPKRVKGIIPTIVQILTSKDMRPRIIQ